MTASPDTLDAIREAMNDAGVQADAALYNEANQLVGDRRYEEAAARLDALLALYPSDAQAWLLRAKVQVARQRWQDALDALDAAAHHGAEPPAGLRDTLERRVAEAEAPPPAPPVADADVEGLKAQLRHARSQNQMLVASNRKLERETNWWAAFASGISVLVAILVVVQVRMLNTASQAPVDEDLVAEVEADPPPVETPATPEPGIPSDDPTPTGGTPDAGAEAPPETPDPAGVRDPGLASEAARALADADADHGGRIRVTVRGRSATLTGKADTHLRLRTAIEALEALDEIDTVDADAVINLARRDGATYTVGAGDSLSRIAYRHYGDQSLSTTILEANPQLGGRTNLQIGDRLTIPPVD